MKEITVKKALVEVKVLKVGNRQVTQSFIRQIIQITNPIWLDMYLGENRMVNEKRNNISLEVLGWINYSPDFSGWHRGKWHTHIENYSVSFEDCRFNNLLFTVNGELRRAYVPIIYLELAPQLFISI